MLVLASFVDWCVQVADVDEQEREVVANQQVGSSSLLRDSCLFFLFPIHRSAIWKRFAGTDQVRDGEKSSSEQTRAERKLHNCSASSTVIGGGCRLASSGLYPLYVDVEVVPGGLG